MYVYTYVCMYACMHACMHACMRACVCVCFINHHADAVQHCVSFITSHRTCLTSDLYITEMTMYQRS